MYGNGMYAGGYGGGMGMAGGMAMGMNPLMGMSNNPNYFYFIGNSLSLQSRLDSISDEEAGKIVDANINVVGVEVKPISMASMICTMIWASIIIIPFFFMCMSWWKRCTYPIYDVPENVYSSLGNITKGGLKNLTLNINDNCFNANKANILYNLLQSSSVNGFTLINNAHAFDWKEN